MKPILHIYSNGFQAITQGDAGVAVMGVTEAEAIPLDDLTDDELTEAKHQLGRIAIDRHDDGSPAGLTIGKNKHKLPRLELDKESP